MSELNFISYSEDVVKRASDSGLVMPKIGFQDMLQKRLSRVDLQATIDENHLLNGIHEIGVENQFNIQVRSSPSSAVKKIEESPSIGRVAPGFGQVLINSKPNAEYYQRRRMNQAFWSGLLLTNAVTENFGLAARAEQAEDVDKTNSIATKALYTALGISCSAWFGCGLTHIEPSSSVVVGGAIADMFSYGTYIVSRWKAAKISETPLVKYIERESRDITEDLAISYPALEYTFLSREET
jgi:hypothetical protein